MSHRPFFDVPCLSRGCCDWIEGLRERSGHALAMGRPPYRICVAPSRPGDGCVGDAGAASRSCAGERLRLRDRWIIGASDAGLLCVVYSRCQSWYRISREIGSRHHGTSSAISRRSTDVVYRPISRGAVLVVAAPVRDEVQQTRHHQSGASFVSGRTSAAATCAKASQAHAPAASPRHSPTPSLLLPLRRC